MTIYAIAMALVEAAVVIYLRDLYYPSGFLIHQVVDLSQLSPRNVIVEVWREAATIVMLGAVAYLSYATLRLRFWALVWCFAIWDLGYYLFLYVFLRWPPSLTTQDVYFLIPRPWLGPVWVPITFFIILGAIAFRMMSRPR